MQIQCSFCGKDTKTLFKTRDWNRKISKEAFIYRQCPDCGLVFLSNVPDDLEAYYGDSYYPAPSFEKLKKVAFKESYQLAMILEFVKTGRLLEVGGGFGVFAYQAKKAGFDVAVIEKEERCCNFLSDIIGVKAIRSASPHKIIESEKGYDVIALWQVIEHLQSPWEFLANAARSLNTKGVLLIAAPNPDAFQFRLQGPKWPHIDAPRHLNLIPITLLVNYLKPFGLEPMMIEFDDKGGRSWNRFGWQRYLMNYFSNKWFQAGAFILGHFLAIPMGFFDRKKCNGSAYTVIFQKSF